MNVDQRLCGSVWHLPSPSSTPQSTSSPTFAVQTPRVYTQNSSQLRTVFQTPEFSGNDNLARVPDSGYHSVTRRAPSPPSSLNLADPKFHVNHLARNPQLLLPPVEPSRRLSSSPGPVLADSKVAAAEEIVHKNPSATASETAMDSAQMQTPPPTRDSSSKRKNRQDGLPHSTQSAVSNRVLSTPGYQHAHPSSEGFAVFHTPMQYPGLQFSPDAYHFPGELPSSVPALPQAKFEWNTPGPIFSDDPFATPQQPYANDSIMFGPGRLVPGRPDLDTYDPPEGETSAVSFYDPNPIGDFSIAQVPPGVDPSMVYSFPINSPSFGLPLTDPDKRHTSFDTAFFRKPVVRQTESMPTQEQHLRRGSSSSSHAGPTHVRPVLHRSSTEASPIDGRPATLTRSTSLTHIPRNPSPLKRNSYGLLSAIPETARNRPQHRMRLVIDEDGRARTETDGKASSRSPRERYPELYEDSSDSDLENDLPVLSRYTSFNQFPDNTRPSKQARMSSFSNHIDSAILPRPSSVGSLSSDRAHGSRCGSAGRDTQNVSSRYRLGESRRLSMPSFNKLDISPIADPGHGADDAQDALERLVRSRITRRQHDQAKAALVRNHNARWAQNPSESYKTVSPFATGKSTTPATVRSNISEGETRCVCQSNDDNGQEMIQCESCMKWLHIKCVGLDMRHIPPVYVCIFCTGQTPVARGGRVREHHRAINSALISPLGHKGSLRR